VLAIVSAIVFSLVLIVFATDMPTRPRPDTFARLQILSGQTATAVQDLVTRHGAFFSKHNLVPVPALVATDQDVRSLGEMLPWLDDMAHEKYDYVTFAAFRFLDGPTVVSVCGPSRTGATSKASENFFNSLESGRTESTVMVDSAPVDIAIATACRRLQVLNDAVIAARSEALSIRQHEIAWRVFCIVGALFLYAAFFNTLSAVTISVIETLALQTAGPPQSNGRPARARLKDAD
jgi:hypothetical protein